MWQVYLIYRNIPRTAAKMRKQRNMFQMKKQDTITEKELKYMDASNLPDTEFKTLFIRIFNYLRGRIDKISENLYKKIETIKKGPVINEEYNN